MLRSIFRPYGTVWNLLNNITDALFLSLCWCFCCLPIFTIGAATTALYDSAAHGLRHKEPGIYRRFFRTFKNELKTASAVTLLWGVILLFGFYVLTLLNYLGQEDTTAALLAAGYQVLMLVPMTLFCWSAILLSRFADGFVDLTKNAFQVLLHHPLASLGIAVVARVAIWYCTGYPIALTFVPAVAAVGWTLFAEPVFQKYDGGLDDSSENDPSDEEQEE